MSFFSTGKKIKSRDELQHLLRSIGTLEQRDRQLAENMLVEKLPGGITRREVIKVTRQLANDKYDEVSRSEALAIRRRLINFLRGKW